MGYVTFQGEATSMKTFNTTILSSGFCLFVSNVIAAPGLVPTPATKACLVANPGLRAMVDGERLTALYGVPIATDSDPGTNTDQFMANFLAVQANVDALGVDSALLEFKDKITIRNGKFTVYTYTQKIEGLPVHGSIVKLPVLLGATEKISYAGINLVQHPENPLPPDVLSDTDAIAEVTNSAQFGHITNFDTAEKVICEAADGGLHRTWRFFGNEADNEAYMFFVDTNNGDIVAVTNQVFDSGVSGTVTGWGTPGIAADDPVTNPPELRDLVGAELRVIDGTIPNACPSDEGTVVAEGSTDSSGAFSFPSVDVPARVFSALVGDWSLDREFSSVDRYPLR